jgi:hypothetical protein
MAGGIELKCDTRGADSMNTRMKTLAAARAETVPLFDGSDSYVIC